MSFVFFRDFCWVWAEVGGVVGYGGVKFVGGVLKEVEVLDF